MAIIAILATIAVPIFLGQRTKAMRKEAMANLEAIRLLQEQYYAEHGEYAPDKGTCAADEPNNITAIQDPLPAFKPGLGTDLFFSYCIEKDKSINTADTMGTLIANSPCFVAQAFGKSGSQIEGQEFRVDCNNVKTY
jgi:type II secretory pathway pseudopilin PulG